MRTNIKQFLLPESTLVMFTSIAAASGIIMDGSGEKIGFKLIPDGTSAITHINLRLTFGVSSNETNFKIGVFAHDWTNNCPDDSTQLGGYTASFAGTAGGSSWINEKALASNTGTLTRGTPVWVVLEYSSGTALDSTHSAQANVCGATPRLSSTVNYDHSVIARHHNGTNWITTAVTASPVCMVVKHADNSYSGGSPMSGSLGVGSATDIYGTNRQGIRFMVGSDCIIQGVAIQLAKTGSHVDGTNDLLVKLYQGTTLKDTIQVLPSRLTTNTTSIFYFPNLPQVIGGQNCYVVLSQLANAGSDSIDWDIRGNTLESANYMALICSSHFAYVTGTGDDPTALTASTAFMPIIIPFITDIETDLVAGGGQETLMGGGL